MQTSGEGAMEAANASQLFGVLECLDLLSLCKLTCTSRGWRFESVRWRSRVESVSLAGGLLRLCDEQELRMALSRLARHYPRLRSLDLRGCRVPSGALRDILIFANWPRLERLDLRGCPSMRLAKEAYGPTSVVVEELSRRLPNLELLTDVFKVRISLVWSIGREVLYAVKATTSLALLFARLAKRERADPATLTFVYQGHVLPGLHTLADVGFQNGHVIDVFSTERA